MAKYIVVSVPFLFVLALAGTAAARRPPALAEAQEHADRVYATCTDGPASSKTAYRDMHARLSTPRTEGAYPAMAAPVHRKMGDHLVLVCKGGEIHLGSGYRGFPARLLRDEAAAIQIATVPEPSRNQ